MPFEYEKEMDVEIDVGVHAPHREYFRYLDLLGRDVAASIGRIAVVEPERLYALVDAVTEGNISCSVPLLWRWGIFSRAQGTPTLSCDIVRLSELRKRYDKIGLERHARAFRMLSTMRPYTEDLE